MQVFFDLDHTLWDFEANSQECLIEIFEQQMSEEVDFSASQFVSAFSKVNREMWASLEREEITHDYLRDNRFKNTLKLLSHKLEDKKAKEMNDTFLDLLPSKTALLPNSLEILDYCQSKYQLHIISNGFYDVQLQKMRGSGIFHYFSKIVTNEVAGARKPSKKIFEYALQAANCKPQDAIMVGDSFEADILGSQSVGMKAIYFAHQNPEKHEHHITDLLQLKAHL